MASRELAFSNPEVIRVASERFVPLAENCSPLQTQRDAKGEFFRLIAEQGHYGGRTVPSATRQGQYAFTADGRFLASINTRDPDKMLGMMHQALERWALLDAAEPGPAGDARPYEPDPRHRSWYPDGGLVLKVVLRDLPRRPNEREADWRSRAVNFDYAWFTREEAAAIVPKDPRPGARHDVPWPVVRRLARFHLLDAVRGETPSWRPDEVRAAGLSAEVVGVEGPAVHLVLTGTVLSAATGTWAIRPFQEKVEGRTRGYHCRLRGELTFDTERGAFTRFDLLAAGDRWGGTEHNVRWEDLEPAPLGVAFRLAGSAPADRTPPHANLWDYFDVPPEQRPK